MEIIHSKEEPRVPDYILAQIYTLKTILLKEVHKDLKLSISDINDDKNAPIIQQKLNDYFNKLELDKKIDNKEANDFAYGYIDSMVTALKNRQGKTQEEAEAKIKSYLQDHKNVCELAEIKFGRTR